MQTQTEQQVIETEVEYRSAVRALDQKRRPAAILRLIMNALEAYRQARKMGWSRPQNKQGLTVFQSFQLNATSDRDLIDSVFLAARAEFSGLTPADREFLGELRADPGLLAFVFVHDLEENGRRFEGITYSLGRRAKRRPRFRDRFDLILDAEIIDGRSRGLCRARAYIDPFVQPIRNHPARRLVHEPVTAEACAELFGRGSQLHEKWYGDPDRHWSHWTTEYIDYFGPRQQPVAETHFRTTVDRTTARRSA